MTPLRFGVLGTARIATERVIPALQASALCDVVALASRDVVRAREAADRLGVARAHAGYEALLRDPDVEAVYNPLPNHLHVEWSVRALEAGKHVLCEKPIAMDAAEVAPLLAARERTGLLVEEAFMVRDHPQWARVRAIVESGRIGAVRSVQLGYAHTVTDTADIRFRPELGGGALYDVGCYCCAIARLVFGAEPLRVLALAEREDGSGVDRSIQAILEFPAGQASFFCSIQASRHQLVQVVGTDGWIRVEVPFAHPPELGARLLVGTNVAPGTEPEAVLRFDPVNQYTLQGERFARLARGEPALARPLEDAIANMRVLDALRRAAASGGVEPV